MREIELDVNGMMCEGCENRIKKAVGALDGVENVSANHESGKVLVTASDNVSEVDIKEKIEDIGFEVKE